MDIPIDIVRKGLSEEYVKYVSKDDELDDQLDILKNNYEGKMNKLTGLLTEKTKIDHWSKALLAEAESKQLLKLAGEIKEIERDMYQNENVWELLKLNNTIFGGSE